MINEYFYELIALALVFTLIIIYLLLKKSAVKIDNKPLDNNYDYVDEDIREPESLIVDAKEDLEESIQENLVKEAIEPVEEEPIALTIGEEEGSFGIDENNLNDVPEVEETQTKKLRQKCEVPEHGKISKEDFKEFSGVKLLIAEDNLINQKVLKGLLNDSGIELTMADDGQIALDILEENSDFNMILMDAHMPRVDGFEATRAIRKNPKYDHILIVAFSGDVANDDIKKMTEAGMEEHLQKPLSIDDFYDILYAYTKSTNDTVEDNSDNALTTKELNIAIGLDICGGDEGFYKEILSEFTMTYSNAANEILKRIRNNEVEGADRLLLDFIGIAANIGAENMKLIATELKTAITNTDENDYLDILNNFDVRLEILLKEIADYNK